MAPHVSTSANEGSHIELNCQLHGFTKDELSDAELLDENLHSGMEWGADVGLELICGEEPKEAIIHRDQD